MGGNHDLCPTAIHANIRNYMEMLLVPLDANQDFVFYGIFDHGIFKFSNERRGMPARGRKKAMNTEPTPTLAAVDQPRLVLLGRGTGRTHADEIKSLGLKVGDTIRGKEGGDTPGRSWWHEVRLRVLWVGEKEVVYRKQWRSNHHPAGWHDDSETANFTLSCREYYLEENA